MCKFKIAKSKNYECLICSDNDTRQDEFLDKIKLFDQQETSEVKEFKRSRKTAVLLIDDLVFKRYNKQSLLYTILHMFSLTRSERNLQLANYLQTKGISVPKGIAAIKFKQWGMTISNVLVMEDISPNVTFANHAVVKYTDEASYQEIVSSLTNLLYRLHENKFYHGDLSLRNIFFEQNPKSCGVIDLDGSKHYKHGVPLAQRCRELARIISSFEKVTQGNKKSRIDLTKDFANSYKKLTGIDFSGPKLDARVAKFLK